MIKAMIKTKRDKVYVGKIRRKKNILYELKTEKEKKVKRIKKYRKMEMVSTSRITLWKITIQSKEEALLNTSPVE